MIDLPTPETDAVAEKNIYGVACKVDVDFARKLERERDEAREALEAVNALEEMHAKPGSMEIAIKQNPAQAQWVAKCFASMVAASPNYTEMKFDLVAKEEKWEWLTVLIQKGNGQTPHQLRQKAENERDEAKDILRKLLEIIPEPECHDFGHTKEERHAFLEECPVMARYDAIIAQATEAVK